MSDNRRKDMIAYAAVALAVAARGMLVLSGAARRAAEAFELLAENWAEHAEDDHTPPPPMPTGPTGGITLPTGPDYTPPPRPMPPSEPEPEPEPPTNP